jgi:hypothetical protein
VRHAVQSDRRLAVPRLAKDEDGSPRWKLDDATLSVVELDVDERDVANRPVLLRIDGTPAPAGTGACVSDDRRA